MIRLPQLNPLRPGLFPDPEDALVEPNGLLAWGGDLSAERLIAAYAQGVFPWFNEDEPILWWSPDPRCVFRTDAVHISRSLRKQLSKSNWRLTADTSFTRVMRACAAPRSGAVGTWIGDDMIAAYEELHRQGHAHSVEVWDRGSLVGGIYGVAVGRLFCGESMFSARTGGSKVALAGMCQFLHRWGFPFLDAQVTNDHLLSMGAVEIPRRQFVAQAKRLGAMPGLVGSWMQHPITLP
ncbi:leucyl/phenylalanyl-tRNA--protein transferase [Luteibacter rhizovicinus DSM 16549]|uniref:Leucyl/phenylalanyl-tRNA--protein transferase n=1 Tax=Luteibacter rhizovicinus DSM 16549 TaxID=1440763 RepID=A0A0G9H399_9GAMM|nr:leucyl/phenylalanyl-tRNA--protein transferase [Luteibacter rhizovicinus]APG05984.1 leucyl/phenylalanyl-tRNA--protein transferase [Luteibacter rhizovicinus DSM 16549]KLD63981.1 leucyl/phenylalanyl-tRNA--protein transferase [Luteibacter rhizovicinus DSM 16549]KLD73685.1 leucyl/phenylalanyl-tRNA--protein transferase [Xanthomonas hyacinthi DSM 19077]